MRKELNLNAYYYSFNPTGCNAINEILSAVAYAGHAYHETEDWNTPNDLGDSPVDRIQKYAIDAASYISKLEEAIKGALRIKDLWVYGEVSHEYIGEAQALNSMLRTFKEVLKEDS